MAFIVSSILGVVFIAILGMYYLQMQEAKKVEIQNKSLNKQVREIQTEFRDIVTPLYTDNIVNGVTKQRVISIASNFFVFQAVNEANIDRLLSTLESCSSVFDQCIIANKQYPEQFPEVFEQFIKSIPASARDFSTNFYVNTLPTVFEKFSLALDSLGEIQEVEVDLESEVDENEEQITSESEIEEIPPTPETEQVSQNT